jgi:hypothetical protein
MIRHLQSSVKKTHPCEAALQAVSRFFDEIRDLHTHGCTYNIFG